MRSAGRWRREPTASANSDRARLTLPRLAPPPPIRTVTRLRGDQALTWFRPRSQLVPRSNLLAHAPYRENRSSAWGRIASSGWGACSRTVVRNHGPSSHQAAIPRFTVKAGSGRYPSEIEPRRLPPPGRIEPPGCSGMAVLRSAGTHRRGPAPTTVDGRTPGGAACVPGPPAPLDASPMFGRLSRPGRARPDGRAKTRPSHWPDGSPCAYPSISSLRGSPGVPRASSCPTVRRSSGLLSRQPP